MISFILPWCLFFRVPEAWVQFNLYPNVPPNCARKCEVTAPNKLLVGANYEWIDGTEFSSERVIDHKWDVEFTCLKRIDIGSLDFTPTTTEVCRVSAVSAIFARTTSGTRDVSRCLLQTNAWQTQTEWMKYAFCNSLNCLHNDTILIL